MEDAQGVMRGGCRECSCRRYVLPMVNRCDYCNHLPIAHQELQPAPVAAPVPSSSSSSTKLATSPRTKHLFQQQAPAEQVSKPHRHGSNTSSSSLATDPLESASTADTAASLLAYVEAQLHKRNGTTPSLPAPQDPPASAAATVLASQSSVDELLSLLRAHLAGAPPPSSSATPDAATSPTPRTTPPPPQSSAATSSLVHTPSPASLSSSTTPATPAANAGPALLPTPLFPASPVLAPPPTPPPQSSSALAATAAEANGVDCTAATAAAPAVSAAGRRKKSAITAAAAVAAATKAVSVAAPPTTPAAPAAAAADGQLTAKKNRARKRSARARSRSKVGSGLELPHGADASSSSISSNGHLGDEEDDEAETAFDDDHDRDELDAEYADEPSGLASTSDQQPHEAHPLSDARDEAAQSAPTAMTVGGQQQPEPFVRRNTGGRRRPQPERAEELIPLSFLTNALFTPPPQPPQPQPSADVPAPAETKRVKGVGTGDPKFSITIAKCVNKTLMFHTISAMPEYCGKSFEELRWEDYQLGNRGTQTRPSLFSLIDTSSPPYLLPSPSPAAAVDRAPSPPPASLLPRSLQGFFDSASETDADPDAQPPLDLLPPPPIPVASAGHSARDEAEADGGEEEERIIYRTPSKSLLDDKTASAPSPLVLTSSATPAPTAPHKEVDAAQLAPGSRLRARNAANRTRVTRLYEELYELVEQLGRQVAAAGDDGDTTTPAPFSEADALLHRIHAATRDYAFATTPPAASLFTSGTPLSPPLFALPPPPHSPYSPLASASAAAAAAMGAPSPAPSPSPGFSALSPAPSAPVYTAFPPPASSPFALRSFPVPMDLSYFKRYYIKGSYVPFLEDFAHEFKDVARNKKEHYFAIINHPKLEANLSAFLNSRDGGTLYFGIHDSGQVIGVSITRDQLDSLKNMIWAKMETFNPVPDPHLYRIEIVPVCNARATALIKDLYVVEIHITGGTRLYFNREDRAWVRRDAGNHCLKSGAEVRDFIEQRGKERRQERRGEKRRADHHDSPASSSSSSSSSTSMDTNLDDGGGLTMRPLTPRAHSGGGSGMRGTPESGSGGVGAATTTTTPGPTSSAAALQSSPVPLLFPLRRPVHRDGRVAPVWLKTWSSTGPADGSHHATAVEAANLGDHLAAGTEATATASKKPKRATTPDNAAVDGAIANDEAETEVGHSAYSDATDSVRQHDRERGGEVEAQAEEQGGDADRVQAAAAPDTAEETTAAAPAGDEGLLDQGATNEETTDKREEEEAAAENEENELSSHAAQESENWERKMRDLEADLARLSADASELVSLSWIPTPEAAATAAASSDETTARAASPDLLKKATAPASELKERPASPAEVAVSDDATTANTNTGDGADADVALAAGADVPSAAALVDVDDNEHQGESGQRKTDVVPEEENHGGGGGEGGVEEAEEVKADEAILAFGPTLGVTNASTVPAPAAATGALPPFSFADFSSSFFSSFSLPSSLYSPSPSPYAPLSATNTTSAPSSSSSSSSSSPPSSPSPSSSPALRSSTKRSLAAFLPSVGAKAGRMASPSLLPVPAAAATLDATPTPGADRGSTATATAAAAAETEEKKMGKNRRKKEQRMLKSNGNRPATLTATADTDDELLRPTPTDHAADGSADESDSSESEGKTEEKEEEKEPKEKTMEAELEKLERELEADRRQFVAQFASCFADLATGRGASHGEAEADDEAKAEGVSTS